MFYIYFYTDPTNHSVRYVGVGSKSRAYDWGGRSKPHASWIRTLDAIGLEPQVVLVSKTRDKNEAFIAERQLIAWHREHNSPLFNVTAGGMGMRGVKMSDDAKLHLSQVHKAKFLFDPIFREKRLSFMSVARAAKNRDPEFIAKIRKHDPVHGKLCAKCGGTLRYKTSRNCVGCAKIPLVTT